MKKDKRKLMEDASEAWVMESPEKRIIFCVVGDKESNSTSCGVHGREDLIVEAIVNECLADETIAQLVLTSAQVYRNVMEKEEKEKRKETIKKTSKIYS